MIQDRFIDALVQESTPSIIANKLRSAIGYGELAPGTRLGEAELAKKLGVSRGPLREAMQRLTQEGLLVSVRNRGLFVITMTVEDIRDMYLARTAVELAAAIHILQGNHQEAGARLLGCVHQMSGASTAGDAAGVGEADIAFHELLVVLAGSPRLTRMHNTLLTETRICITALQQTYPEPDERVDEHTAIAKAVSDGDRMAVQQLLQAHMDDALDRLAPQPGGAVMAPSVVTRNPPARSTVSTVAGGEA